MPTVMLGPRTLTLGHDDCEGNDSNPELAHDVVRVFGWDNESPARTVEVKRVRIGWRPVTNAEYLMFWKVGSEEGVEIPSSWVLTDQGVQVRFVLFSPR